MSGRTITALIAAAAVMAAAVPAAAAPGPFWDDLGAVVAGGPTGALVQVRDGHSRISLGIGERKRGTGEDVDPTGWFRAGSVTKMMTATVVLQLVGEHRVGLDDVVFGGDITVRQLLGHTSGLYDYTRTLPLSPPSAFLPLRWKTWAPQELVDRALAQPRQDPPGYSSTDYIVLGMLIERLTGHPYGKEIERRLHLRPGSFPGTRTRLPEPHAQAYLPDGDGDVIDITEMNPSVMGAAGELVTDATALNDHLAALLGGRLLRPAELTAMKSGLGLEVRTLTCGRTAFGHSGDALGASAWSFATDPDHAITLSVTWGTGRPSNAAVTKLIDDALCRR
ncbi:serine hydrolase domain-containing protein [Actinoplanes sp. HUAS TT8]|uniref:serine hydrolase domain-containing protein n=1 Tax=Actinoplanes sp. HUAS TT8 TaxID=3447453 RepID=UPI003F5222DD